MKEIESFNNKSNIYNLFSLESKKPIRLGSGHNDVLFLFFLIVYFYDFELALLLSIVLILLKLFLYFFTGSRGSGKYIFVSLQFLKDISQRCRYNFFFKVKAAEKFNKEVSKKQKINYCIFYLNI